MPSPTRCPSPYKNPSLDHRQSIFSNGSRARPARSEPLLKGFIHRSTGTAAPIKREFCPTQSDLTLEKRTLENAGRPDTLSWNLPQVNRVATARELPVSEVNDLVEAHIQGRTLGFIGQERVNVLELNLALAAMPAGSPVGAGG